MSHQQLVLQNNLCRNIWGTEEYTKVIYDNNARWWICNDKWAKALTNCSKFSGITTGDNNIVDNNEKWPKVSTTLCHTFTYSVLTLPIIWSKGINLYSTQTLRIGPLCLSFSATFFITFLTYLGLFSETTFCSVFAIWKQDYLDTGGMLCYSPLCCSEVSRFNKRKSLK